MRSPASIKRWLPLCALLLSAAHLATATPYPRDALHDAGYSYLMKYDCESYCGSNNELCCQQGSVCETLEGAVPTCVGGHEKRGEEWGAITTTWTETRTFTSTIMTHWIPAPEPTEGVDCIPKAAEQEACGEICCAGWQTCAYNGQCSAKPGYQEPTAIIVTTDGKTTTQYSAPYRITGTTTIVNSGGYATATVTETASETETGDGEPTETSDSGNIGAGSGSGDGGLSAGAIAGIVIGSIAGAMLLLLLAFCCIARGLWKACFGRKRKETVDVYDERYSRHGSRPPPPHAGRKSHGGWFGRFGGGGGDAGEKKSGGGKWLGLAGLAAGLLALLNMKKDKKPVRRPASRYSGSYYSYSDTSRGAGSSSSGRRTHRSRRTGGGSRGPPKSYYSESRDSRSRSRL